MGELIAIFQAADDSRGLEDTIKQRFPYTLSASKIADNELC